MRQRRINLAYLLMSITAVGGCAQNWHLTKASQPEMVSGDIFVQTLRKCLSDRRLGAAENFELCDINTTGDSSTLTISTFNKSGGRTHTVGTRMTTFSPVARERMHSREIVDLLDLALTNSTEATLIWLSQDLVCSRLTEIAHSDAGVLILNYAAERELCPAPEIQRAFLLSQSDKAVKGIKASLPAASPSNSRRTSVENATSRLLEYLVGTGDFEITSLALRTISSSRETSAPSEIETSIASPRSSPIRSSPMAARQASLFDGKYARTGSLIDVKAVPGGSPSIIQIRTLFLKNPAAFTSNIDETCAQIGGVKPIDEATISNREIYLRRLQPGCYALSASVPLTLIGAGDAESAAGTIIILRRGAFKLLETSKSGAIVVAPKLANIGAVAPRIYGFPVYFYVDGPNVRPKEILAFHWVSGIPRREDGAYIQADVKLAQPEPLVHVEQSTAAIARLLLEDDMSEIRLDLAGPALGFSFGGIFGTPLRILKSTKEVCSRIRNAKSRQHSVTVPANWDEALTPSDRIDRAKFCPTGDAAQCFVKVTSDLGCTSETDDNSPLPDVLNANVTKFVLGKSR